MIAALRAHWPEYLIEAVGLGVFMIAAGTLATLFEAPGWGLHDAIDEPLLRRALTGVGIGLTFVAIVYSPWGRQSGAHLNPAVTLTFFRLGKIGGWDVLFYVLFQVAGGLAGVLATLVLLGRPFAEAPVRFAVTIPGGQGEWIAFAAELAIAFGMMTLVLTSTNSRRLTRYTGWLAGVLLFFYILLESPLSGMSLNPARTVASALPANLWTALWIYFTAPLAGMLLAAELYVRRRTVAGVYCAKLHHGERERCIFRCRYHALQEEVRAS